MQNASAKLGKPDLGRISIGASQFPENGQKYSTLYELADAAMYNTKAEGRSESTVFQQQRHDRLNNAELGKKFLKAVEREDILPYFQPIVELKTGVCKGFEVLARWRNSDGTLLEPVDFQSIFQDHSMAEKMTRTIMRRAFRDFAQHVTPRDGRLRMALNVTYFDLMNADFVHEVQAAAVDHGLDWNQITIEVTEQTLLGKTDGQVFRSLRELQLRGAVVVLDDFGTGYGGLRHLVDWPIDGLKIDKFFVDGLHKSSRDRAVLHGITGIANELGLRMLAEGIETPDQIGSLAALGCQMGQGYALARPLAGHDLGAFQDTYALPVGGTTARAS